MKQQVLAICSLGRTEKCNKVLESFFRYPSKNLDAYVFVEPHEEEIYRIALADLMNRYPQIAIINLPESGQGVGFARWIAYKLLAPRYKYIISCDDDTKMSNSSLGWKPMVDYMEKHPKCAWVGAWLSVYDLWAKGRDLDNFWPLGGQCCCLRSKYMEAVGGWYNRLYAFEDCELAVRFLFAGYSKALCPESKIVTLGKRFQDGGIKESFAVNGKTIRQINDDVYKLIQASYQPCTFISRRKPDMQLILNFKKAKRVQDELKIDERDVLIARYGELHESDFHTYFRSQNKFLDYYIA